MGSEVGSEPEAPAASPGPRPPRALCPHPDSNGLDELHTADLLAQARGGNDVAWEVFYRRYRVRLLLDARHHMRGQYLGTHDTEDIVQSAFLAAWSTIQAFEYNGEGSFRAWLRRLVVTRVLSRLRQRAAEARHLPRAAPQLLAEASQDPGQGPEALAERAERTRRLLACLEELPELERDIVVMRDFERKRWREVAECCGRSLAYVQSRYGLAFKRLALRLGPGEPDSEMDVGPRPPGSGTHPDARPPEPDEGQDPSR